MVAPQVWECAPANAPKVGVQLCKVQYKMPCTDGGLHETMTADTTVDSKDIGSRGTHTKCIHLLREITLFLLPTDAKRRDQPAQTASIIKAFGRLSIVFEDCSVCFDCEQPPCLLSIKTPPPN